MPSEFATRIASAIVMVTIAGLALWFGGLIWTGFVVLLAGLVLWEFNTLVRAHAISPLGEVIWLFFGAAYVGAAAFAMIEMRANYDALGAALGFIAPVVAVDVGAYFAGRRFGGPKIAPSISPSKTWAGLAGGAVAASCVMLAVDWGDIGPDALNTGFSGYNVVSAVITGSLIAIIAQAGDFFESWMKRRAGVKDSGALIPGHGGFFDRLDGFIAVFFVLFVVALIPALL